MREMILQWQDNWINDVTPPTDAEDCFRAIEAVVPAGTSVVLVRYNKRWKVVKADTVRAYAGPIPERPAYLDLTVDVTAALEGARLPREDYPS